MSLKICVLGGGSWGATIASHLSQKGFSVSIWEYSETQVQHMRRKRTLTFLPQLKIHPSVSITSNMQEALKDRTIIFSVVPSQFVRSTWKQVKKYSPKIQLVLSLTKGLELKSLKRMTEVIVEECPESRGKLAVLSGPSHAEEVCRKIPTAVVVASEKKELAKMAQQILGLSSFRVYTNSDVIGVELCGALKNIYAIACGVCDGLGLGDNSKSALITRGLYEMTKLGKQMGGNQFTFFGLAGMGDLVVTCFSKYSRNRLLGEKVGRGKKLKTALKEMMMVAEGVPTSKSAYQLAKKCGCDCPIITEIYRILYEGKSARKSMRDLLMRPMREESKNLTWE